RRRGRQRRRRALAISAVVAVAGVASVVALALGAPSPVHRPPAAAPVVPGALRCTVGFYVESLHDSNVAAGTFGADLWMWSVCADGSRKPLDSVEFTNANSVTKSFSTTTAERDGSQYSSMRVTGVFRHAFTLARYPFDTQRLQVQFEDSDADASLLLYTPDTANTACAPGLALDDWAAHRCSLTVDGHTYRTTFGDPSAGPGTSSTYAQGTLSIDARRAGPVTEYLKSTSIIYPSVLLVIISFFLMTEATNTLGARMSTSGGALFSVALSMKALSSQLNADSHFTLMDGIGLAALACVVFAGAVAMWCQRQLDREVRFAHVRAVSQRLGWSTLMVFLAANAAMVWAALR
ncbi:MAG TPA: hypothetical protein VMU14_03665, partial [Acidimicrobiales bacterium]|nr:hypothetical protein [Acidimicrobiales bacterium]